MPSWIAWMIAVVSTTAFVVLWFWEARRILQSQKSTVESAAAQLAVCRKKAADTQDDPELTEVLKRSESIYRQAVDHYNSTLRKPWVCLPAILMGFNHV